MWIWKMPENNEVQQVGYKGIFPTEPLRVTMKKQILVARHNVESVSNTDHMGVRTFNNTFRELVRQLEEEKDAQEEQ